MSLVPPDFDVPLTFSFDGVRLEPLGPQHNERDYAAWTSSMAHIHATPGFETRPWPHEMPIAQNLDDLVRHAADFADRTGFTYSVLIGDEVIGCVYIYPGTGQPSIPSVRSWVTEQHADLDAPLFAHVKAWLLRDWPFTAIDYRGYDSPSTGREHVGAPFS